MQKGLVSLVVKGSTRCRQGLAGAMGLSYNSFSNMDGGLSYCRSASPGRKRWAGAMHAHNGNARTGML